MVIILRKCAEQLAALLRARDTCIYAQTYEEEQFIGDVCNLVTGIAPYKTDLDPDTTEVYTYSRFEGLHLLKTQCPFNKMEREHIENVKNIPQLFHFIWDKQNMIDSANYDDGFPEMEDAEQRAKQEASDYDGDSKQRAQGATIFILKDMHMFFDKEVIRAIRDIKESAFAIRYTPIIVTSPTLDLPCELEKIFTLYEYSVMDYEDCYQEIYEPGIAANFSEEKIAELARSCTGLTFREIMRAFQHSRAIHRDICTKAIHEEKIQIVKKSGVLDFLTPKQTMEDTGGYENLKTWIRKLKISLDPEAKAYGIPQPKGAMFVGLPGNGKTMAAEVIANYLGVPLLQLDLARIMGSFVGQSERAIANALRVAKACAPCVLLIDESEKLFGGYKSSSNTDSGTLSRVLAQLLQFLQDDNTGVITIMTSNNVFELPPELTRNGRLDAQWYFGFPNADERREIFDIYLRKNTLNVPENVLRYLIGETKNYSGAEIKDVVKNLVVNAFYRQKNEGIVPTRDIIVDDAKKAIASVIPVYVSSEEKIKSFIDIAKGRYLTASTEAV